MIPNYVKVLAPIVLFTISATVVIETRFAKAGEVEIAELEAQKYAVALWIADLTGRSALYVAKEEAGTLTEPERARWAAVLRDIDAKTREIERLQSRIDAVGGN